MAADVGEGIFFAGSNHVALRVVASEDEHEIITTDPAELVKRKAMQQKQADIIQEKKIDINKLFTQTETKKNTPEVPDTVTEGQTQDQMSTQDKQISEETGEAPAQRPTGLKLNTTVIEDEPEVKKANTQDRNSGEFIRYSIDDYQPPQQ
jgi:hypothetical protein